MAASRFPAFAFGSSFEPGFDFGMPCREKGSNDSTNDNLRAQGCDPLSVANNEQVTLQSCSKL